MRSLLAGGLLVVAGIVFGGVMVGVALSPGRAAAPGSGSRQRVRGSRRPQSIAGRPSTVTLRLVIAKLSRKYLNVNPYNRRRQGVES
jgi:hypothetical protein